MTNYTTQLRILKMFANCRVEKVNLFKTHQLMGAKLINYSCKSFIVEAIGQQWWMDLFFPAKKKQGKENQNPLAEKFGAATKCRRNIQSISKGANYSNLFYDSRIQIQIAIRSEILSKTTWGICSTAPQHSA